MKCGKVAVGGDGNAPIIRFRGPLVKTLRGSLRTSLFTALHCGCKTRSPFSRVFVQYVPFLVSQTVVAKRSMLEAGLLLVVTYDGMTPGPAIDFPSIVVAAAAKVWIDSGEGTAILKGAFESTSLFAKLQKLKTAMASRTLYVRFADAVARGAEQLGFLDP